MGIAWHPKDIAMVNLDWNLWLGLGLLYQLQFLWPFDWFFCIGLSLGWGCGWGRCPQVTRQDFLPHCSTLGQLAGSMLVEECFYQHGNVKADHPPYLHFALWYAMELCEAFANYSSLTNSHPLLRFAQNCPVLLIPQSFISLQSLRIKLVTYWQKKV